MNATAQSALLSIRAVRKSFGAHEVLRNVSLEIGAGEFLTILGESGSGKTTLLRLIAGFEQCDVGEIWLAGERIDTLPPYRRRVNTVFQQYALFPHLTVLQNVMYGLRAEGVTAREASGRAEQALALVKMEARAQANPSRLSGGQQQRVALARALVKRPLMLLLDEPLSALDANLRQQMRLELKSLQREIGISFVFVTHDQEEAMALSDRIALLRAGTLEQVATPEEIYNRPATAYTARFIGQTNLLKGSVSTGQARVGAWQWPCSAPEGAANFSLRPEHLRIAGPVRDGAIRFAAQVRDQAFQGAVRIVAIETPDGQQLTARLAASVACDKTHEFEFDPSDVVALPPEEAD
jgi:ABC-type Fe3+/spermidine/putrescine transport system ATPase subunit